MFLFVVVYRKTKERNSLRLCGESLSAIIRAYLRLIAVDFFDFWLSDV
jgi:ABC-type iron transport system FetAB permease component